MESYRELTECHSNLSCLEDALKKQRANLLAAYKPESGINTEWLISKASCHGLADALNKEMAKFHDIMLRLDGDYDVAIKKTETETVSAQCVNDEVKDDTQSSSECEPQHAELYKDSVTVSENSSVHSIEEEENENENKSEIEQPQQTDNKLEESVASNMIDEVNHMDTTQTNCENPRQSDQSHQDQVDEVAKNNMTKSRRQRKKRKESGPKPRNVTATPTWNAGNQQKQGIAVAFNRSDYKYKGNGFTVYKGKPIYSITTLFCSKTFGFDEQKVRDFMGKSGGFSAKKIASIQFINGQFDSFCLIKVRAPINLIKKRLKTLNNDENIVHIFERRQTVSRKSSRILFVQNFDILNRMSHKKMTNLFMRFGELAKDIEMRTDSFGNPLALVYFKHLNESIACYQASKMQGDAHFVFDGKVLDVSFNKF